MGPWSFGAGPRAEELDWIAMRLSPSAIELQRFVQPPSEIVFSFHIPDAPPLFGVWNPRSIPYCLIPALFPAVKSDASYSVDICRPADLVVPDHTRFEENADGI